MALEPNSPARNVAAVLSPALTSDQRGFPIVGMPDIGAYEAGTLKPNYNAYIWESLPVGATVLQHDVNFDYDGDGVTNFNEWMAQTNPGDPTSYLHVSQFTRAGSTVNITFPSVSGINYYLENTTSLASPTIWVTIAGPVGGDGTMKTLPVGPITGFNKYFLRIRLGP